MDDEVTAAVGRLEAAHPRWRVWQADTGEWWASVRRNLTKRQTGARLNPYVRAQDPDALAMAMAEEDSRA